MNDKSVSELDNLKKMLVSFRNERDWKQFHSPVNLAIALQLESTEVLECFQWKAEDHKFSEWIADSDNRKALEDELADVLSYLLLLSESLDVDLYQATLTKIRENAEKYPVHKSKGNSKKYNQL